MQALRLQTHSTMTIMRTFLSGVLTSLIAAGCSFSSIGELRELPPTMSKIYQAEYEEIATCSTEAMRSGEQSIWSAKTGNLNYELVHRKSIKTVYVTAKNPDRGFIILDMMFSQHGTGTLVETRQGRIGGELVRGPRLIEEQAWPIIERCATP